MLDYPNPFKIRQFDDSDVGEISRSYPTGMGRLKRVSRFFISLAFGASALYVGLDAWSKIKNSNNNFNKSKRK